MSDPRWPLPADYRIERFGEGGVSADDVLALWARERAVAEAEAQRRIAEVAVVATHVSGELVGVATAYTEPSPRLRVRVWRVRVLVATAHRRSNLSVQLMHNTTDLLAERFRSGGDTEAPGILLEIENDDLMRSRTRGYWRATGFSFIGVDPAGRHLRLRWFPGAVAPAAP